MKTKYHKETTKCGKCGKTLRFPVSELNHGKTAKILGATMCCQPGCLSKQGKAMLGMARHGGM